MNLDRFSQPMPWERPGYWDDDDEDELEKADNKIKRDEEDEP